MHAERDAIAGSVVPALKDQCRTQRLKLVVQDGRWGIVEAQTKGRDIVATCMEAIESKQPIVIGIVPNGVGVAEPMGTRPGRRLPWLEPGNEATDREADLDLIESLLDNPYAADRTYFYLRDEPAAASGDATPLDARTARLRRIRQRIRTRAFPVRTYATAEELGDLVLHDLFAELDRRRAAELETPALELERRAHGAFADSRRVTYVPIGDYEQRVNAALEPAAGRPCNVAIVGPPGVGKSALAAYWAAAIRADEPDAIVVEHYVGYSPMGSDARAVLTHILMELRDDAAEPIPVDLPALVAALGTWPARVRPRSVVIVIDALDRLDPEAQRLDWLGRVELPTNVRLVVTAQAHTTAYSELDGDRWTAIEMTPLTLDQRWAVVAEYMKGIGRPLTEEQMRGLSANSFATTPLFIRTIVEEMRFEASFAVSDGQLQDYLKAENLEELFAMILARTEARPDFGRDMVKDVMSFLWASRRGLTADELFDLLWPAAPRMNEQRRAERGEVLAMLLARLESYLIRQDGMLRFSHDQFKAAVEHRYLGREDLGRAGVRRKLHARLAEYFGNRPIGPRRVEEAPYQLFSAGKAKLAECVLDVDMVMALSADEHRQDLLRYWRAIGATDDLAEDYLRAIEASPSAASMPAARLIELFQRLGDMFIQAALYRAAERILKHALDRAGTWSGTARIRVLLASVYHQRGEFDAARAQLRPLLDREGTGAPDDRATRLDAMSLAARIDYSSQNYDGAQAVLAQALPASTALYGHDASFTLGIVSLMSAVALANGNYYAAEHLSRSVLKACRKLHGEQHPDTSAALSNVAAALRAQASPTGPGRAPNHALLAEALALVTDSLAIDERVFGEHHSETAFKLINLGSLLRLDGQLERAGDCYRRAMNILRDILGDDHPEVANCLNNLGTLLTNLGQFREAEEAFEKALAIRMAKYGPDSPFTIGTELNLAYLAFKEGRYALAVERYELALPKKKRVSGEDHPETLRSIANYKAALEALLKELESGPGDSDPSGADAGEPPERDGEVRPG